MERRSAERLGLLGMRTAADLRDLDPRRARQPMAVVGERLVHELRGVSCLPLDLAPWPQQGLAVSRSFGQLVTVFEDMLSAVVAHGTRAAEKLRSGGLSSPR